MVTLNFAGVPDQKSFEPIPAGKYILQLVEYKEGEVTGENSKNKGATKYDFTYEVTDNDVEEYNGRKLFDNVTLVENSLWRLKAMLKAFGLDIPEEGEFEFDFDELIGENLEASVRVSPARKVGDREYQARNNISQFIIPETE